MTRRRVYVTLAATLALFMLIIALQNTHDAELHVLAWTFTAPLILVLPGAALFGSALTLLIVTIRRRARRRRAERELRAAGGRV